MEIRFAAVCHVPDYWFITDEGCIPIIVKEHGVFNKKDYMKFMKFRTESGLSEFIIAFEDCHSKLKFPSDTTLIKVEGLPMMKKEFGESLLTREEAMKLVKRMVFEAEEASEPSEYKFVVES